MYRNAEIFHMFHEKLLAVDPNYDRLEKFSIDLEESLQKIAVEKFGFVRVYLFSVLNSVVFSELTFKKFREEALKELSFLQKDLDSSKEVLSVEDLRKSFEQEKMKLEEKFEKRLQGILKKTQMEVGGYRKQKIGRAHV